MANLSFREKDGTGLATCKLCGKKIKKNEKAIWVKGWRTEGQVHRNNCTGARIEIKRDKCELCDKRTELIELISDGEKKWSCLKCIKGFYAFEDLVK